VTLNNCNTYNSTNFKDEFIKSEIYCKIEATADIILWEKNYANSISYFTPRQVAWSKIATMSSFYYINYLYEFNPSIVYDIGCGVNWFKQWYPNIHGIGEEQSVDFNFGDEQGRWDGNLINKLNNVQAMFAINSLHFRSVDSIPIVIEQVISVLAKKGRAYLAFNTAIIIKKSRARVPNLTTEQVIKYLQHRLYKIEGVRWLVVDMGECFDYAYMDGNINLVLEKC
jgi:hypothetical protein